KNPQKRYQNAQVFAEDLQLFIQGLSLSHAGKKSWQRLAIAACLLAALYVLGTNLFPHIFTGDEQKTSDPAHGESITTEKSSSIEVQANQIKNPVAEKSQQEPEQEKEPPERAPFEPPDHPGDHPFPPPHHRPGHLPPPGGPGGRPPRR
ncbi:MAG: hypothetical protein HRU15_07495, partial [Planctomycetes bacterium]|nr:hypothetical protein [Planctomycetota bacterium]